MPAVLIMGLFVFAFHWVAAHWIQAPDGGLYNVGDFIAHPGAPWLTLSLLGIAMFGGIFVVPLYAFLTTTVKKSEAARTVAANNIINSGAMVIGSLIAMSLTLLKVGTADQLLLAAAMCSVSAYLAWRLHRAVEDHNDGVLAAEGLPPTV